MSENKKLTIYLVVCFVAFWVVLATAGCADAPLTVREVMQSSLEEYCACAHPADQTCVEQNIAFVCTVKHDCDTTATDMFRRFVEQCVAERQDACVANEIPCGL